MLPDIDLAARHDDPSRLAWLSDRIRDAGFPNFYQVRQSASVDENTVPLAEFLDIPPEKAREIAGTHYLFVD